jgi:hypothetical protein
MVIKICPLMRKTNVQVLGFQGFENLGSGLQGPGRLYISQKTIIKILASL